MAERTWQPVNLERANRFVGAGFTEVYELSSAAVTGDTIEQFEVRGRVLDLIIQIPAGDDLNGGTATFKGTCDDGTTAANFVTLPDNTGSTSYTIAVGSLFQPSIIPRFLEIAQSGGGGSESLSPIILVRSGQS